MSRKRAWRVEAPLARTHEQPWAGVLSAPGKDGLQSAMHGEKL